MKEVRSLRAGQRDGGDRGELPLSALATGSSEKLSSSGTLLS